MSLQTTPAKLVSKLLAICRILGKFHLQVPELNLAAKILNVKTNYNNHVEMAVDRFAVHVTLHPAMASAIIN